MVISFSFILVLFENRWFGHKLNGMTANNVENANNGCVFEHFASNENEQNVLKITPSLQYSCPMY